MINLKINGMDVSVPEGSTILEACRSINIEIPTLCYMKEINAIGACRICVVEVKGARSLVTACVYPVNEGMEVFTNTPRVLNARKNTLKMILSTHNRSCLSCVRSGNCELQTLCTEYGIEDAGEFDGAFPEAIFDSSSAHMVRDNSKCILCRRCVAACKEQQVGVIGANDRGFDTHISCAYDMNLAEVDCISCGQCIVNCPTGALHEKDNTAEVYEALADESKYVVVQTAPAVRAALGEEFGMEIGTDVEGKMVAALRRLGFNKVFDTNTAADFTIIEESNELIDRVKNGGALPLITSCSPGWIKYCEYHYPELLPNVSSCKSPQQMFGALTKTWYAEKNGIDPKDIVVVSVMPCTAKKFEIGRDDQSASGVADVDIAITTRELALMIKRMHINFTDLPDEQFDNPMGESTGAAVIFGATGGVMEAALRTAVETITGETIADVDIKAVRGTEPVKVAEMKVGDLDVKVGVASGIKGAKELLERVKAGENFTFIEIMGCPGGCVNGGGQPIQPTSVRQTVDLKAKRASALYSNDAAKAVRKSHENPLVKKVYEEYLEAPGSHKAHKILHTTYVDRSKEVVM
ncbi:MAG: iron hydrogenase small subunit [Clostridia bacterium]|nr:iron hydrogenase small subunit [Clostridia bacterium]